MVNLTVTTCENILFLTFIFLGSVVLLVWHFCFGLIFSFLNTDVGGISKQGAICNDYSPTAKRILLNNPLNRGEANDDLVMMQTSLLFKGKLLYYHAH